MSSSRQQRTKETQETQIEYAKISGINLKEGNYVATVPANWILEREHRLILTDTDGTRYLSEETKRGQVIFWPPKSQRALSAKDPNFQYDEDLWPFNIVLKTYVKGSRDYCDGLNSTTSGEGNFICFFLFDVTQQHLNFTRAFSHNGLERLFHWPGLDMH